MASRTSTISSCERLGRKFFSYTSSRFFFSIDSLPFYILRFLEVFQDRTRRTPSRLSFYNQRRKSDRALYATQIDSSPFYGMNHKELKNSKDEFYVMFNGIDSAFSQTIHDVHYYKMDHLLINHHLVDILHRDEEGTRYIDYEKF